MKSKINVGYSNDSSANIWGFLLHLSVFAGTLIPFGGIVLPIVIWQVQKSVFPVIDEHGKVVINWMISYFIYCLVAGLLCFVFIGFVLLPIVIIVGIVFPIIGAIKASSGEVWRYPMSINFIN